jgi:hypothetical protein
LVADGLSRPINRAALVAYRQNAIDTIGENSSDDSGDGFAEIPQELLNQLGA